MLFVFMNFVLILSICLFPGIKWKLSRTTVLWLFSVFMKTCLEMCRINNKQECLSLGFACDFKTFLIKR